MSAAARRIVWFFDLDNTLHDASHAIFAAIEARMTDYLARRLGVAHEEAARVRVQYWRRYGATLLGMVRHHGVDAAHFLQACHDIDVPALLRAERGLNALFTRLPGRKVLLTNAPERYAASVLRELALTRHFGARHAVEAMRLHGRLRPKPSRAMLAAMLARERARGAIAVLVDDSAVNLKAARAVGYRTVLVTGHMPHRPRAGRAPYVGLRLRSVRQLPRRAAAVRRG